MNFTYLFSQIVKIFCLYFLLLEIILGIFDYSLQVLVHRTVLVGIRYQICTVLMLNTRILDVAGSVKQTTYISYAHAQMLICLVKNYYHRIKIFELMLYNWIILTISYLNQQGRLIIFLILVYESSMSCSFKISNFFQTQINCLVVVAMEANVTFRQKKTQKNTFFYLKFQP